MFKVNKIKNRQTTYKVDIEQVFLEWKIGNRVMDLGVNRYRFTVIYNLYITKIIQHQYHIVQI